MVSHTVCALWIRLQIVAFRPSPAEPPGPRPIHLQSVHFLYAFEIAYKFDQVAFDVSQEPFVGLYIHAIFLFRECDYSIREHEDCLLNVSVGVSKACKRVNEWNI